ncbi:glycosyltransferase [Piscinibacter terrae]|uniref:Glycosyltransferase n=1 Tax=Piscinibacter terrae TaxID=2496871 RepID=A0A3N7HV56_9BURK|nr:glycosyltransferase [Albitalea terrae]RQP25723.1 glycosyltransferase [Albitalea terrae]
MPHTLPTADDDKPEVAMLLIAYNQVHTIGAAIEAALAQDYSPLTIVVSDDASSDGSFDLMQRLVDDYQGPHRIVLNRNPRNLGIGAHLSHAASLCPEAQLLFVTAGDDVSLPHRCSRTVQAWLATGRKVDLIAASLEDIDAQGRTHSVISPSDLGRYRDLRDWLAQPPHVVGAAQAWTRRLLDRFGPLPEGVVAEDLVMVFRAIGSGGAMSLPEPLVRYRRGGISRRVRTLHASDVVARLLKNNRHALVELPLLLADARTMGQLDAVQATLETRLARETFIRDLFDAKTLGGRLAVLCGASSVPWSLRIRLGVYAACPWLLAPWFWLKRRVSR